MSHFSVLVIGDNPEGQLAPYDENAEVPRYKSYEDRDPDSWPRSHAVKGGIEADDDAAVAAFLNKEWDDDEPYEVDEKGLYRWSTYNPQSKWDWYELGGRWTGHLKLKVGHAGTTGRPGLMTPSAKPGTADQALKGAVDFEGMQAEARQEAGGTYDRYAAIAAVHPPALDFDQIEGEVEERRATYWSQPLVAALSKANLLPWSGTLRDIYGVTREEFVTKAGREAPTTYALVAEGAWKGRGRMGWFGMSSDEIPHDEWVDFWWRMVDGLPDDTLLSVYDLHI